ncbi:hypothetical protein J2S43_005034 [Catenuloplanes nepalensis]|uniref:PH domain-containing protein n=1 Tax=Catenuloplanes nepalensis TaxID=587533 RepID=A0ABT9MYJ6_9ACTN|nr:hypothetical protein [Catenuloplanes nepalensis]MDP9796522.1 hypothetical protein [Catenuloplanes nepalensis]
MSRGLVRLVAVVAALAAVLLRFVTEGFVPDSAEAGFLFIVLFLSGLVVPIVAFLIVAGRLRPQPRTVRAGDVPGTLVAPARLLFPGSLLIVCAWLVCHVFMLPDPAFPLIVLAVVDIAVGVLTFVRPRPRLVLDADGVTILSWYARRAVRVRWDELDPGEPVWTANGTFFGTGTVTGLSLARTAGAPVPIPATYLDVEPAHLAGLMAALAVSPDRRTFIDSRLLTV